MPHMKPIHHPLICIGNGHKPPNLHKWGPGVRDLYALHYIVSGSGILETRGSILHLKAGDSFIIYPDTEVFYYPDPRDPWAYVWLEFTGDEVPDLLSMTQFTRDQPIVAEAPRELASLYPVAPNADARPFERTRAEAQLRLLLSYYLEYYPNETKIPAADYAVLAKQFIEHHYWKANLTVADIVNAVQLERSYLFRLFKIATGRSLLSYLTDYRIQRACELLRTSDLSIKSIAYSVGYKDQLYFSRVFKKATSHTPSEYMTLHREQ
ncbi:AraC-like DNA-binding protein [Paenibacillus cellulosilyticus]|uniref:AraC-like DNA-binding protein n=1 Tax=Paenibacillus cellulosilyticus TaxID=375489 RepID=A0A2V2YP28_9BACL|nr:helix-turn-helix domain-containing protein [Paenibacillus cellulosilyticus]PWV95851.1 AraC-like DNA-binding protein [Paenibacillus cellulosilyticus]QKS47725.1 helix-turn-helix domain-containing protein [Paenibacillus cellulosilyticus]